MPTILEQIQALVAAGRWDPSEHGRIRRDQRGIQNPDLVHGLAEAIVVELYNDPGERPAVLLLQYDRSGIPLHVFGDLMLTPATRWLSPHTAPASISGSLT